jgi:hypothetical protein
MYLFWKRNTLGDVSVSSAGIRSFVRHYLTKPFGCDLVSLPAGEDCLFIMLSHPKGQTSPGMGEAEERIRNALEKLGFSVRISWVEVEKTPFEPFGDLASLVRKPLTWALLGAALGVLFMVGFGPFFWTLVWGAAFYFATVFLLSEKGERILKKLKGIAGR